MSKKTKQLDDLDLAIKRHLKDPEFKDEWEKSELQYQLGRQIIQARIDRKMSQRELAKKAGTTQAVISRVESLSANPTIELVGRIARALGKSPKLDFA